MKSCFKQLSLFFVLLSFFIANPMMAERPIRVLSLDGGGIRGLVEVVILAEMEKQLNKPISEIFDVVAGSSIGGIVGLALSMPDAENKPKFSAQDLVRLFTVESPRIFSASLYHNISTAFGLLGPKYESDGLKEVLEEYMGDTKLSQSLTDLLITGYHVEGQNGIEFLSNDAQNFPGDKDCLMREVALATGSSPLYFDVADVNYEWGQLSAVADGGLYSNNPTLHAYAHAKSLYPNHQIQIVSLGTGHFSAEELSADLRGRGLQQWMSPIIRHLQIGDSDADDSVLHQLLNTDSNYNYYRLNTHISREHKEMDDNSEANLEYLIGQAEAAINTPIFKNMIEMLKDK